MNTTAASVLHVTRKQFDAHVVGRITPNEWLKLRRDWSVGGVTITGTDKQVESVRRMIAEAA